MEKEKQKRLSGLAKFFRIVEYITGVIAIAPWILTFAYRIFIVSDKNIMFFAVIGIVFIFSLVIATTIERYLKTGSVWLSIPVRSREFLIGQIKAGLFFTAVIFGLGKWFAVSSLKINSYEVPFFLLFLGLVFVFSRLLELGINSRRGKI